MKKLILTFIAAMLLSAGLIAQTTITISGTVTSTTTGLAVPNHPVYIMSDSSGTPAFFFYTTVSTNANGYYSVAVTVPANLQPNFYLSTYDCNQQYQSGFGAWGSNMIVNFNICTSGSTQCQASFYAISDSTSGTLGYYFIDQSVGNPISWLWSFGDGTSASTAYPYHTYTSLGYYTVCLTINTSTGCTSTYCDSIYVGNILPNCSNYFTFTTQLLNASFNGYAYGGTQPYTYLWNFGDNTSSTSQYPNHTYAQTGYYVVTLTTTDGNGCTATSVQTVSVTNGSTGCQAWYIFMPDSMATNTIYFFNQSTGNITNYLWNFGDNTTSTLQNPTHTYAQAGVYSVCLTIYNNATGCTDYFCDTINVGGIIMPCSNYFYYSAQLLNAYFYGSAYNGTAPYTYLWTFGDGTSGTGQNPSHLYASSGTYTVTLTTTDATGCSYTSTQVVTVNNSNPITIYGQITANNLPVDFGKIYLFTVNPVGNTYYLLDTTSIDSSGYYWFSNVFAGSYVILAELDPNSSMFGQYMPTYYGNTIFWANATLITLGQPANPYNIELQAGIPPMAGPGNITGTITSGIKFNTNGAPIPNIEIMLLDMSNAPLKLDYSDAAGQFNFSNLPYGTYKIYAEVSGINTNPAIITLNASNPNANTVSLLMTPAGITTGIPEKELSVNKIYPNPATDKLTLDLSSENSCAVSLIISDILGNEVQSQSASLVTGNNRLNINTSDLAPGSYTLVCARADGSRIVRKIAIVR